MSAKPEHVSLDVVFWQTTVTVEVVQLPWTPSGLAKTALVETAAHLLHGTDAVDIGRRRLHPHLRVVRDRLHVTPPDGPDVTQQRLQFFSAILQRSCLSHWWYKS